MRLREEFEQRFDPAYGTFLEWMEGLRPSIATTHPQFSERKRRWYELVDSEVLALIRDGREAEARQLIAEIMGVEVSR